MCFEYIMLYWVLGVFLPNAKHAKQKGRNPFIQTKITTKKKNRTILSSDLLCNLYFDLIKCA